MAPPSPLAAPPSRPAPSRPGETVSPPNRYVLGRRQRFSESVLWDFQRRYFAERGIEAWRGGEVPHYITSNPIIANLYAEVVFAAWLDFSEIHPEEQKPFTVLELGAGSGRLAFHFLCRLTRLCEQHGVPVTAFRYVLSDTVEANRDFWRHHPQFQAFFKQGLLEVAQFDVHDDDAPRLDRGGRLKPNVLGGPLVVIANYVFDSVPQELFRIGPHGARLCRVSVTSDVDPTQVDAAELLRRVEIAYQTDDATDGPFYDEPWLQSLLDGYAGSLADTHLLFPASALRCLDQLAQLSPRGLILLSADKGNALLSELQARPAPELIRHGSFHST